MFLILFAIITILQVYHRRLLHRLLPAGSDRWVTPALLILHSPLVIYMAMRLTGHSAWISWLRPLARMALYFQAFTMVNLALGVLAVLLWRIRRFRHPEAPEEAEDPGRRKFLRQTTILGMGLASAGVLYGRREAHGDPEIVEVELAFDDLPPGLDGLRIAQISDLHAGPLVKAAQVRRWRELVQAERPEILVITGDIVDSLPEEAKVVADAFRDFPAPLGRFAILGNHDYFTDPHPIWKTMEAAGFQFLENRWSLVYRNGPVPLALVGLQDPMALHGHFRGIRYGPGPSPFHAIKGLPPEAWRLCLSHRPTDWPLARATGSRLTLSGHTHGGQINLIPGLNSALIIGPYTEGIYREGRDVLYVNRGLGVVALPVRLGSRPEITLITLRKR